MSRIHETWSSRTAFLLATVGAAVGLGNIWRFPFMAGQNGGGAFVLVYLGFVVAIGIPIAIAELLLGRRGHSSPVNTMRIVSREEGLHPAWVGIGWMSIGMPLAALSFYTVIASWSLEYVFRAAAGWFAGLDADASRAVYGGLMSSPGRLIMLHTIFVSMTVIAVAQGVRRGIEFVAKLFMPALFVILLIMVGYGIVAADFTGALNFMFAADFSQLSTGVVMMALGQAFFSLSVGGGYLMTYGAYLPSNISIPRACTQICLMDAAVAMLAGLAIFPIVLTYGFATDGGPGLMFESLPLAFGAMPGGRIIGTLFFLLLAFAAFTSTVSMLEPAVAWLQEHRGWRRRWTAPAAGLVSWSVGIIVALSFNVWSDVKPLAMVPLLRDMGIFALLDFVVANLVLPTNALMIAIFVAWMMARRTVVDELGMGDGPLFRCWQVTTRYIVPLAILAIFVSTARSNLGL
ncbi:MAG: sodium-dependent transporter [Gammaproteobacteria bacterium]|nr:sodium-dependent transporter [Gammaproteobacteria bacterium]